MKNFNIIWAHFFRGGWGCLQKTNIEGGDYLKRGDLDSLQIQGGLGKKERGMFLRGRGDTPVHTMLQFSDNI